jgi:hypothetical protein
MAVACQPQQSPGFCGADPGSAPDALVRPDLIPRTIGVEAKLVRDRLQTQGASVSGSDKPDLMTIAVVIDISRTGRGDRFLAQLDRVLGITGRSGRSCRLTLRRLVRGCRDSVTGRNRTSQWITSPSSYRPIRSELEEKRYAWKLL